MIKVSLIAVGEKAIEHYTEIQQMLAENIHLLEFVGVDKIKLFYPTVEEFKQELPSITGALIYQNVDLYLIITDDVEALSHLHNVRKGQTMIKVLPYYNKEYLLYEVTQYIASSDKYKTILTDKSNVTDISDVDSKVIESFITEEDAKKRRKTKKRFMKNLSIVKNRIKKINKYSESSKYPTLSYEQAEEYIRKNKKQLESLSAYVYGGIKIQNTKFTYFLLSDSPAMINQRPVVADYRELQSMIRAAIIQSHEEITPVYRNLTLSDTIWLAPLNKESWFVMIVDETNAASVLKPPRYPVFAYFLHVWSPSVPETVILIDADYIVGIVKWQNTILDLRFTARPGGRERLKADLSELLFSLSTAGIPRVLIPFERSDRDVLVLYKEVKAAIADIKWLEQLGLRYEPEFLDIAALPTPKELPRHLRFPPFWKQNAAGIWGLVYDFKWLEYLKKAVNQSSVLLLLTGLLLGFSYSFTGLRSEFDKAYVQLQQINSQLQHSQQYVVQLKQYNVMAKTQAQLVAYLARLYALLGDRILSLSYDAKTGDFRAEFRVDDALTLEQIQNTLLSYALADEVKVGNLSIKEHEVAVRWTYKHFEKGGDRK